jgi:hypothetical protein
MLTTNRLSGWYCFIVVGGIIAAAAVYIANFMYFVDVFYIIRPFLFPVGFNKEVTWETGDPIGQESPNVVLILLDDLGFNDISFYGGGYHFGNISTPHIDSIAQSGLSFDNAYAGHATCSPSRAALLTGRYSTKIGHEFTPSKKMLSKILGSYM